MNTKNQNFKQALSDYFPSPTEMYQNKFYFPNEMQESKIIKERDTVMGKST